MIFIKLFFFSLLCFCVNCGVCVAVQNTPQAAKSLSNHPSPMQQKPDTAIALKYDEQAVNWATSNSKMIRGFKLAEALRLSLLKPVGGSSSQAAKIGEVLEAFRTQDLSLKNRPDLSGFTVTSESFVAQLRGQQQIDPQSAFSDFNGRWYGVWNGQAVDHNWHKSLIGNNLAKDLGNDFPKLKAYQYAWIGDGFGWNYLAEPRTNTGKVVLGFVHHLQPFHHEQIKSDFPLVGFKDDGKRLIWVTAKNVFFEEVFSKPNDDGSDEAELRYAITGFDYSWKDGKVAPAAKGFQAVYSRNPNSRPKFLEFDLKPIQ